MPSEPYVSANYTHKVSFSKIFDINDKIETKKIHMMKLIVYKLHAGTSVTIFRGGYTKLIKGIGSQTSTRTVNERLKLAEYFAEKFHENQWKFKKVIWF